MISPNIKILAYFGLVRPLLEYAAQVWDSYTDKNIRKTEIVQRRATRFVVWNYNRAAKVGVILDQPGRKSLKSIVDKLESDTDLSRQDLHLSWQQTGIGQTYKISAGVPEMDR